MRSNMLGFLKVNKKFLPLKFHYGLLNAGIVTVQPTMPVYAKVLKLSSFIVGLIYTILPLFALIIKPLFGGIADKYKKHRAVLITWEVITVAAYFAVQYIPPPEVPVTAVDNRIQSLMACSYVNSTPNFLFESNNCAWTCHMTDSRCEDWKVSSYCTQHLHDFAEESCISIPKQVENMGNFSDCSSDCSNAAIFLDEEVNDSLTNDQTFHQWQFWIFLILLVAAWSGTAVITTLSDTICIENCGGPHLFGRQRMWGSFSWGIFAAANGFIIDAFSTPGEEKNYVPAFYLMLVPLLIDIVLCFFLDINLPEQSENIGKDAWKMMTQPRTIHMTIGCILVGVSFGIMWNFFFWLLEDIAANMGSEIKSQIKTIEGVLIFAQCYIGEGPAFFFGGWVIDKAGYNHSMSIIFLAIGLRFILYSIVTNPWYCVPIEIFQNNHGFLYSTMTAYAKEHALPGTEATMQSILSGLCEGVGVALGSFIAGLLYDNYGGYFTFRVYGIFFLALVAVNECVDLAFKKLETRSKKGVNNNEKISCP